MVADAAAPGKAAIGRFFTDNHQVAPINNRITNPKINPNFAFISNSLEAHLFGGYFPAQAEGRVDACQKGRANGHQSRLHKGPGLDG